MPPPSPPPSHKTHTRNQSSSRWLENEICARTTSSGTVFQFETYSTGTPRQTCLQDHCWVIEINYDRTYPSRSNGFYKNVMRPSKQITAIHDTATVIVTDRSSRRSWDQKSWVSWASAFVASCEIRLRFILFSCLRIGWVSSLQYPPDLCFIMIVICKTQQYAWGKQGSTSEVARIKKWGRQFWS